MIFTLFDKVSISCFNDFLFLFLRDLFVPDPTPRTTHTILITRSQLILLKRYDQNHYNYDYNFICSDNIRAEIMYFRNFLSQIHLYLNSYSFKVSISISSRRALSDSPIQQIFKKKNLLDCWILDLIIYILVWRRTQIYFHQLPFQDPITTTTPSTYQTVHGPSYNPKLDYQSHNQNYNTYRHSYTTGPHG